MTGTCSLVILTEQERHGSCSHRVYKKKLITSSSLLPWVLVDINFSYYYHWCLFLSSPLACEPPSQVRRNAVFTFEFLPHC